MRCASFESSPAPRLNGFGPPEKSPIQIRILPAQFVDDLDIVRARIDEIKALARFFERTGYLIHEVSEDIAKALDEANRTCNLIQAAIKIQPPNQRATSGRDEEEIKIRALSPPSYYGDPESWLSFWERRTSHCSSDLDTREEIRTDE